MCRRLPGDRVGAGQDVFPLRALLPSHYFPSPKPQTGTVEPCTSLAYLNNTSQSQTSGKGPIVHSPCVRTRRQRPTPPKSCLPPPSFPFLQLALVPLHPCFSFPFTFSNSAYPSQTPTSCFYNIFTPRLARKKSRFYDFQIL